MKPINLQHELSAITDQLQLLQQHVLTQTQTQATQTTHDFVQIERYARQMSYEHHPLARANTNIQGLYCLMLAAILPHMTHDVTTNLIFLARIRNAIAPEQALPTLLEASSQLDDTLFDEFLPQIKQQRFRYNFIVDALILSSCHGQPELATLHYIAELANLLGLSQAELEVLTQLSRIILQQDASEFAIHFEQLNPFLDQFMYYTQTFVEGVLVANHHCFKFSATTPTRFPIENFHQPITSESVEITGAIFDLSHFTIPLTFKHNTSVQLSNSRMMSSKGAYLPTFFEFERVKHVSLQNLLVEGVLVTTPNQPLKVCQYKQIDFLKIQNLSMQHNQLSVDLGELKAQNALLQAPELVPFHGAFMAGEAVAIAKFTDISIEDTHTRFQYALQNVLFGGTQFKERVITDSSAHCLFVGLEHAEVHRLHIKNSSQFQITT